MTDTNTKPSEAIQRYETDVRGEDRDPYPLDTDDEGRFVLHCDHLAALARARDEARGEALESLRAPLAAFDEYLSYGIGGAHRIGELGKAVRALLTPTPQGETKEND